MGNVIMTANGPVVIDWEAAQQGYPLLDVAMTYLQLQMELLLLGDRLDWEETLQMVRDAYIGWYAQLRQVSLEEILRLEVLVAAARLGDLRGDPDEVKKRLLTIVETGLGVL